MPDEKSEAPVAQMSHEASEPKLIMGLPVGMFVKGGTPSTAETNRIARDRIDAEKRRAVDDKEKVLEAVGGAHMYRNKFTQRPDLEKACVLLRYLTPGGAPAYDCGMPIECLADVVLGMDPAMPYELTLIIVCPVCKESKPQDQCQIQIRQSNRHWELDTSKAGELIMFEGRPYKSAGIVNSERFACGSCNRWSARICDNKVRPE